MDTNVDNNLDFPLVAMWLRRDPARWAAGVVGGLLAGLIAMGFAMLVASLGGLEPLFPAKYFGMLLLGSSATELGTNPGAVIAGLVVFEFFAAFWGLVYAHFTGTNNFKALLPMGIVWSLFSWVFIWNLFLQSFNTVRAMPVDRGVALLVCLVYGISLTSVAFFDRTFRGR